MCSSTFSAYNIPKNILNHYTTKKGRKHKKLGIGSNEHVGESSGIQKNVNFCIVRSQKTKTPMPPDLKTFAASTLSSFNPLKNLAFNYASIVGATIDNSAAC